MRALCAAALLLSPARNEYAGRPAWARAWLISASTWSAAVCWLGGAVVAAGLGLGDAGAWVRRGPCFGAGRLGAGDGDGLGEGALAGRVALGLAALAAGLGLGCAGPLLLRPSRTNPPPAVR